MKKITTLLFMLSPLMMLAQPMSVSRTFGTNGSMLTDPGPGADVAHGHRLLPNGKLLIGGDGYDINLNSFHAGFAQLDTVCGTLDNSFGNGGKASITFEQRTRLWDMAVQPDGRIVGCGMIAPSNAGSEQWPGVFRLNADGSVDNTFNGTGYHRMLFNGGGGDFTNCFVNGDGSIVCTAAGFSSGLGAVKFLADGTLDTGYGNGGTATLPLTQFALSYRGTGLMTPDGSVISIVLTWSGNGNDYWLALAKFDAAGDPDITFGTGGVQIGPVYVDNGNTPEGGVGASLLPDGRILVSATALGPEQGLLMARFLPDGTLDNSFGSNGVSIVTDMPFARGARHELMPDGSTRQFGLIADQGLLLARNADGTVMTSFGTNGFAMATTGLGGEGFVGGLTMADGRIIGYGWHTPEDFTVVRLTSDPVADALPVISSNGSDLITTGSGTLQWQLDGGDIPGATGSTITPSANGAYTVVMTISPDCIYTSPAFDMLNVGQPESAQAPLSIRPNPASDIVNIQGAPSGATVEILAITGERVAQSSLVVGNALDVSPLAAGTYMLRLNVDGRTRYARVVVQE